ncbi:MAG: class I SAM-dependent methyltransferase [Candidatus Hodarchaeota archaeon]
MSQSTNIWTKERIERFIQSMKKLIKSRYKPFAKLVMNSIEKFGIEGTPKILDIGCGPGFLLFEIKKIISNVKLIGIDSSEQMLEIAKEKAEQNNIDELELVKGFAEDIPLPNDDIEVIVCLNCLHDFKDAQQTIQQIYRVLRSGGLFILKDKNGAYPRWKMRLHFVPLILRRGLKRARAYLKGEPFWLDPQQVYNWMEQLGFQEISVSNKPDYVIIGKK